MKGNSRDNGIDALKCMAAIFIVAIHCASVTLVDQAIHLVGRMSVFLFYMITGFYLDGLFKKNKIVGYVNKILTITVYAYLLYLILYFVPILSNGALSLDILPSFKDLLIWIVSGSNGIGHHLWYLNGLIFAICFIILLKKLKLYDSWLVIIVLFAANYLLASFTDENWIYRNFLFMSTPCILFGKKLKDTIESNSWLKDSPNTNAKLCVMIIGSILLLFLEVWICMHLGINMYRDFYLSLIPLCSLTYVLFYRMKSENPVLLWSSWVGNRLSTYIYIYHFCIVCAVYPYCHGWMQFLISMILTVLISYVHYYIKTRFLRRNLAK